jgi:DNA-directed RNA polymerase subunit beta'
LRRAIAGTVRYEGLVAVVGRDQTVAQGGGKSLIVMNRSGSINIVDEKGVVRERYAVVYGARLKVEDGQHVEKGQILVEWDPYTFSILTEQGGTIRLKDIIDKVTVHEEEDEITGLSRLIIVDSPDENEGGSWTSINST